MEVYHVAATVDLLELALAACMALDLRLFLGLP